MSPQVPPRRPGSQPHLPIERDEVTGQARVLSQRPVDMGSDREFILGELHKQTEYIVGKIGVLERNTDSRLVALEKAQLEEDRTRFEVQKLNASVRDMLDRERAQDMDIGALKDRLQTALRPTVVAEAATEGQAAGQQAGKRAGRVWGGLGLVASIVAVSCMQYCEAQIKNGLLSDPKSDPGMTGK